MLIGRLAKPRCCGLGIRSGHRSSQFFFSTGNGGTAKRNTNPRAPTLCQMNNHPNFRLKQAKERLTAGNYTVKSKLPKNKQMYTTPKRLKALPKSIKYHATVREHGISVQTNENPLIRNDGTSSGAIAAERLRLARRKVIENMARPIESTSNTPSVDIHAKAKARKLCEKPVKEHGLDILATENPVRINDGTSSGAVAAVRLRIARRRALESMRQPAEVSSINTMGHTNKADHASSRQFEQHEKPVKEHGLDILATENPVRINDGTSSGAVAADRLRMARRRALESMRQPVEVASTNNMGQINKPEHVTHGQFERHEKPVKEHGLDILPTENPVRINDGTSSGAVAADRLRIARRKALENLCKTPGERS